MPRRPPTSTLFPYTTLFRSSRAAAGRGTALAVQRSESRILTTHAGSLPRTPELTALLVRRDRKSTRLNSSHTVISYAVFCLKKKKKNVYHKRRQEDTA